MRAAPLLPAVLACAATVAAQSPPAYVWWEAETPQASDFPAETWLSGRRLGEARRQLSGDDWLSSSGPRRGQAPTARYRVTAPLAGTFTLWVRKFWKHGPFRWQFDQQPARECGADCALADSTALVPNVCANWVELGTVELTAGAHDFTIALLAKDGEETTAAFDCFLLIRGPFVPDGRRRPGERTLVAEPGAFAFAPGADAFAAGSRLDLRDRNEKLAGEHGFVRADGAGLRRGDGEPLRWFGVNCGPELWRQSHPTVEYLARKLAKLGVNLVRLHGSVTADADPRQVDAGKLDALFWFVAACRQQGIYTSLSNYFPLWFAIDRSWGIDDYEGRDGKHPFATLFFDERLQAIQRGWLRTLLTTPNPYTGVPLAKEPALAAVELVNEDSLFFWTFTPANVPPPAWQRLETLFGKWCRKDGRQELLPAWNMTRDGIRRTGGDALVRMQQQVRFLATTQRAYYAATTAFVRQELGYGGLLVASNWHTSDPPQLDAVERWTYEPAAVVDAHGYFASRHEGPRAAYAVDQGDRFDDLGFVEAPDRLPLQVVQTHGKPQIVSEIGFPAPNRRRGDGVLVASAYAAGNGIDGLCWFCIASPWLQDNGAGKFHLGTPDQAWTFPLAALLYRRGDVDEAAPVRRSSLGERELFALGGSGAGSGQLDPLRSGDGKAQGDLDPHVFLTGPVVRAFDPAVPPIHGAAARGERAGITRHRNGQLQLDETRKLFTVDAPRCQAASGWLGKAGRVQLGSCSIEMQNDYGMVALISLDDLPLAQSRRILVQAMTRSWPGGFQAQDGRITAVGNGPAQVERIAARVQLRGAPVRGVVALDADGMPRAEPVAVTGSPPTITLLADGLWHLVER